MNSTFSENVNVIALQDEFWRRTKQPEERIPEFAIHLESIARKAFSEFLLDRKGEKALEQLIIERFIAGVAVGNDPMGQYIHLQHPSSLQQAVSLAQHYHAYDEMNPHMQQQSKDQVYNIQEDGLSVDDIIKEVKSLTQEVQSMMSGPAEAETDKKIIQRTKAEVNSMRQELTELKLMIAIQKQEISQQYNLISANASAIDELKQMRSQEQSPYVQPETNKHWVHKKRRRRKRKSKSNTLDYRGSDGVPDDDVTTDTNHGAHNDSLKSEIHDLYDNSPGYDILKSSPDNDVHNNNPGYDDSDSQDDSDICYDQDDSVIFDIQDDSVIPARNDGVTCDAMINLSYMMPRMMVPYTMPWMVVFSIVTKIMLPKMITFYMMFKMMVPLLLKMITLSTMPMMMVLSKMLMLMMIMMFMTMEQSMKSMMTVMYTIFMRNMLIW